MDSNVSYKWWQIELNVSSDLEETLFWKFTNLGITRIASERDPRVKGDIKFTVWVPSCDWGEKDLHVLYDSLLPLSSFFGLEIPFPKFLKIKDEDWSNSWKKNWKPDPVGSDFLILPAWLDIPKKYSKREVIRIDPGSAFGTGSHPTTRLCLEAIESFSVLGKRVADIGCGSGILSLAALKKGAHKINAVDIDSLAVNATRTNLMLNNYVENKIQVDLGSIDTLEFNLNQDKVDLLLCNILAPVIEELAPNFDKIIALNGIAFLSGILVNQVPRIENVLDYLGWKVLRRNQKDSWALISITRS